VSTPIPTVILSKIWFNICWNSYDSRKKAVWADVLCHRSKPILPKKYYGLTVHSSAISCDKKLIKI